MSGALVARAAPVLALTGRGAAALAAGGAVAAGTFTALWRQGSYDIDSWAPLGIALLALAAVAVVRGLPLTRPVVVAALTLAGVGCLGVSSVAWGGLPDAGWQGLDQDVLAACALVAGAAFARRRDHVVGALLAALVAHCGVVLARLALTGIPRSWFDGRFLEGPLGYHNAEAGVAAAGVCIAAGLLAARSRTVRGVAGGAAVVCAAVLLLTQSRGGLLSAGAGLVVIAAAGRSTALLVRLSAVVLAAGALAVPLRDVDAAADRATLARFAVAAAAAACAAGLAALPELRSRALRGACLAAAATAVALGLAAAHPTLGGARATLASLGSDAAPSEAAGDTRLLTLSLNGRLDAWRVAANMVAREPLHGEGAGTFPRAWTRERRLTGLYILQPHSIELELLSELGPGGLALFALFAAATAWALLRRGRDALALGALGALLATLCQASADWTWSFPALVAVVLAACGAAAGGHGGRAGGRPGGVRIAAAPAALVLAGALLAPYLADRDTSAARAADRASPSSAWTLVSRAQSFDPWSAQAAEEKGRIAEAAGDLPAALAAYRAAAPLSPHPWLDEFRAARVLRRQGRPAAAAAACRRAVAGNPGEPLLRTSPCGG